MTVTSKTLATVYANTYATPSDIGSIANKISVLLATDVVETLDDLGILKCITLLSLDLCLSQYRCKLARNHISTHFSEIEFFDTEHNLVARNGFEQFFSTPDEDADVYLAAAVSNNSDDVRVCLTQDMEFPYLHNFDTGYINLSQMFKSTKEQLRKVES